MYGRIIREFKGMGGMDTIGVACGPQIRERVYGELESLVGRQRADQLVVDQLHYSDASTPWWTPISSFDSKSDQTDRVNEFVTFVRYCDAKMPIFVGHSLFFKYFYSKKLSELIERNRPELAENLKKYRLSNATVLAVTVLFGGRNEINSKILDADVLFGGGFHTPHHGGDRDAGDGDGDLTPRYGSCYRAWICISVCMCVCTCVCICRCVRSVLAHVNWQER
jgi:hypothetical protein